jgi:hypothetical protein
MWLTDEVKNELIKRYWDDIVPQYLKPIELSDLYVGVSKYRQHVDIEEEKMVTEYNKLLPYLREYILDRVIQKCEESEIDFDPSKSNSGNPIHFFMTISKNYTIVSSKTMRNFLRNGSNNVFRDKVYKRLKREYLIDQALINL